MSELTTWSVKMTDDLKLVIDPNRYLDKQMRTRLRMQNIQYMTVE